MKSLTLQAPAKLNLFLKVLRKRPDGFHDIETLFERIDLCDEMSFEVTSSPEIQVFCQNSDVPTDSRNLAYRAAQLLKDKYHISQGVKINIQKNIPVAAGLAGGSTNGAATFKALNQLWDLGLTNEELAAHAAGLGSDIPFFLHDFSYGLGTEKGDKIAPVEISRKLWHVLVTPRLKMYTPKVYQGFKMELTKPKADVNILIRQLKEGRLDDLGQSLMNDLESVVFRISPRLRRMKESFKSFHSKGVLLSGSGPSLFAVTESKEEAEKIHAVLSRRFKQVFVVKTL